MLAHLRVPLSWAELIKRAVKEAFADDIFNLAAQQAYYFLFALFPAMLFVIGIASFFPLDGMIDTVVAGLARFAPAPMVDLVRQTMTSLSDQNSGGILTFGFLLTIWSSSGAMVSIITTFNIAYDVTESRPWWKTRLTAIALTIGLAVFILVSMFLVLAGPTLAENIAARMQIGPVFMWTWMVLQWPVVFALVVSGIAIVYYFAPDVEQDWVWITPGAIVATLVWLAVSIGLKFYYQVVPSATNPAYGAIGGIMVLMLWFYCTGIALLMGAELNAEIEHASPYGKDPGERVPGEKKVVGPRAQRLYEEKRAKGEPPVIAIPEGVNCDVDRAPVAHAEPKPSDLIIGALALAPAAVAAAKKVRDAVSDDRTERNKKTA